MAGTRKYEGLPDLDIAPDVYETPELTDDVSTHQATSARSTSQNSDAEDGPETESGIDRRHWRTGQARTRFRPTRVDAENVDFSERLNATRRSYRTFTGRRRPGLEEDELEELGDFSDEEDESLDRKLARLRREVEQIKTALEERKSETKETGSHAESGTARDGEDPLANISKISEALDAVYSERHGGARGAEAGFSRTLERFAQAEESMESTKAPRLQPKHPAPSPSEPQLGQVLSKAADFDSRLTFLENALGLNGSNMPDTGSDVPKLILPTLGSLERLIELATASPESLDAIQSKTRQLVKDAERLHRLRLEDGDGHSSGTASSGKPTQQSADSQEQISKVNALYGVLPTIDSLSPTVPLVLDRLRTLRLIHTSAAGANELLDDVEKRQAEQAEEIEQWRQALQKVEENLDEDQSALAGNVQKMGETIKGLEARVSKVT